MSFTIDKGLGDQIYIYCDYCKHRLSRTTCEAFPEGIPERFLEGKEIHNKPTGGDNGIQFEQGNSVWKKWRKDI